MGAAMSSEHSDGHHQQGRRSGSGKEPTMTATTPTLTPRDRSVLRAVAAGRCAQHGAGCLTVDGLALADQFAGLRLCEAGLITAAAGPVALTDTGLALLAAA
jgi:hypothetical protein